MVESNVARYMFNLRERMPSISIPWGKFMDRYSLKGAIVGAGFATGLTTAATEYMIGQLPYNPVAITEFHNLIQPALLFVTGVPGILIGGFLLGRKG